MVHVQVHSAYASEDAEAVRQVLDITFPAIVVHPVRRDGMMMMLSAEAMLEEAKSIVYNSTATSEISFEIGISRGIINGLSVACVYMRINDRESFGFSASAEGNLDLSVDFYNIYHTVGLVWQSLSCK